MIIGFVMIAVGYALFYWGWDHFPSQLQRYSLLTLLGFGNLFPGGTFAAGQPVTLKKP